MENVNCFGPPLGFAQGEAGKRIQTEKLLILKNTNLLAISVLVTAKCPIQVVKATILQLTFT